MLNKLLSNLPFNPSLLHQVAFYQKRLKEEATLRRIGLILLVLTMFLQMLAVVAPPRPTMAQSNNDILRGGVSSKDQMVAHCRSNTQDFSTILLNQFGITCDQLTTGAVVTVKSTNHNGQLYSMGRTPQGPVGRANKATDEREVRVSGLSYPLYLRRLASFDSGASSSYQALSVKNAFGLDYYILFNCGNIVQIGAPEQPPSTTPTPAPTPKPPITDCRGFQIIAPTSVTAGGSFTAVFVITNNIPWGNDASYPLRSETPTDNTTWGKRRTGEFRALAANATTQHSDTFTAPTAAGSYDFSWRVIKENYQNISPICGQKIQVTSTPTVVDVCPNVPGVQTNASECDVCPNMSGVQTNVSQCDVCPNVSGVQTDSNQCDVCPNIAGTQSSEAECKPCDAAQSQLNPALCLILRKQARNVTQDIDDANNTTAAGGDVIVYTLSVKNTGTADVDDFVIEENISDILQYADTQDLNGARRDNDTGIIKWSAADIDAGRTITREFRVKIKNPIPQTPVSVSDPSTFDLTLTNVYGNTVIIKLPGSIVKTTEKVATTLPNTGPGTSLFIGFMFTVIVGYFFSRSRLLARELAIVKHDYAATGGV